MGYSTKLTHYRPAMPFENRKKYLSVQYCHYLKKYHPSGNLKFNNLGIFQSLKIVYFSGKKSFKFR